MASFLIYDMYLYARYVFLYTYIYFLYRHEHLYPGVLVRSNSHKAANIINLKISKVAYT